MTHSRFSILANPRAVLPLAVWGLVACASEGAPPRPADAPAATGRTLVVHDSSVTAFVEAAGIAEPVLQATVSSKLMGTVTAVLVNEGDRVSAGQSLARIDARDLDARREQVDAGIAGATAALREAELHATRLRALYADSAVPRAQLDAAESGLARAEAGVRSAKAGAAELVATADYSSIRAPFPGTVTQRLVDPGAFAAPGAPLITVQDHRRLRVKVTLAPNDARLLRKGAVVEVQVEGVSGTGVVEAVLPAQQSGLYAVNVLVENRDSRFAAGGTATVRVPQGARRVVLIPQDAVRHQGDLTGVMLREESGARIRWVRLGRTMGDRVEVLSGLKGGETILLPVAAAGA